MNIKLSGHFAYWHSLFCDQLDRISLELTAKMTALILFPHTLTSCVILQILRCVHQFGERSGHNLKKLWEKTKPIIQEDASPKEQQDHDIVEDYIKQFHILDETSSSFRYPITMNLDQILTGEHRINLCILCQRMDELYHFFNGVDGKLSSIKDYRQDMEQYFDASDCFGWSDM